MSERDRLVAIVRSLIGVVEAATPNPLLHQVAGAALLEAAECLVRAGYEPARLTELGVAEEIAYFLDAEYRPSDSGPGGRAPRGPHLRLVAS